MAKNEINAVSETDTKAESAKSQKDKDSAETYVYIGPNLPSGAKLMANAIISGTKDQINGYYKDVIEQYPNVAKLIVPVTRLAESREKIKTGGNTLSKYYNDLAAQIRQKGDVE